MDYRTVFQISAAGMDLEKRRLEVAALNLANLHATASADGALFRPQKVAAEALRVDFSEWMNAGRGGDLVLPRVVNTVSVEAQPRLAHDPGHPHADERGMVRYPAVDQAQEMVTALTAVRAYEANVSVASMARAMATKALELGGQS